MKYENIDLISAMRQIMELHTKHYKEDFELDAKLLRDMAASESAEDKHLLWMSRPNGTHILREREVYIEDTYENKTWEFYRDQTSDPILAYAVEITEVKDGIIHGNLIELDYAAHVDRMKQLTVSVDKVAVTFEDQNTYYLPFSSYRRDAAAMQKDHGNLKSVAFLPEGERELQMILSRERFKTSYHAKSGDIDEHIHQLAVQHGKKAEMLAPLPVAELRKYVAIKQKHPDAMVCFAQNGYFELYGEDARKAAPLLGAKLLEKKVHGKPNIPVTGFREAEWVAGSHKLWKTGEDVLLIKSGEIFKELKGADYIPIGATLMVDSTKCKIDAVDYAADEVRLINLSDGTNAVPFTESIAYVRSFVEDAGITIYDTIPKKASERISIRDKLKTTQKEQPKSKDRPQKIKGKDMEL
ncbi:MutS domain I [Oscillibacter sp. PC13]|uniref:hypothetical protein n=1 Tax=Oscillibacter sp. PC13 TaxID=1855299 RepID=UPI0008E6C69D|nr:hypothetical protein [Oscillibacter sp. PC13]SFP42062.1 MutS domain I [Oscillibacter sp. PC13]